jgi:hypothetical protein
LSQLSRLFALRHFLTRNPLRPVELKFWPRPRKFSYQVDSLSLTRFELYLDITEEEECVGTGFSGIAAGVLLAAVGATSLLIGAVMAAIVFVDRWRNPGASQGYRTLPR